MILLTVGIPASGKSTWAKLYAQNNPDTIRVCRDDLRLMISGAQMLDCPGEKLVTKLVEHAIANKGKKNIIVDQANCNLKNLRKLVDFASSFDSVQFIPFDSTLEIALLRNMDRVVGRVPNEVIHRMADGFEEVNGAYNFNEVIQKKTYSTEIKDFPIVDIRLDGFLIDIDGTLSNMGNRSPYEWNKVGLDAVNNAVKHCIQSFSQTNKKIILLSGRDEICRSETEQWLKDNFIHYDLLLMRSVNNMNKDFVIKEQLYKEFVEPFYNIIAVYDDRPSVIRMWKSLGLHVFNCGDGVEF